MRANRTQEICSHVYSACRRVSSARSTARAGNDHKQNCIFIKVLTEAGVVLAAPVLPLNGSAVISPNESR